MSGYKTYAVALGIVLVAVGSFLSGDATLQEAIVTALTGLGLGTLRHGVKTNA
jgi:hypothetical protein